MLHLQVDVAGGGGARRRSRRSVGRGVVRGRGGASRTVVFRHVLRPGEDQLLELTDSLQDAVEGGENILTSHERTHLRAINMLRVCPLFSMLQLWGNKRNFLITLLIFYNCPHSCQLFHSSLHAASYIIQKPIWRDWWKLSETTMRVQSQQEFDISDFMGGNAPTPPGVKFSWVNIHHWITAVSIRLHLSASLKAQQESQRT